MFYHLSQKIREIRVNQWIYYLADFTERSFLRILKSPQAASFTKSAFSTCGRWRCVLVKLALRRTLVKNTQLAAPLCSLPARSSLDEDGCALWLSFISLCLRDFVVFLCVLRVLRPLLARPRPSRWGEAGVLCGKYIFLVSLSLGGSFLCVLRVLRG